MELEQILKDDRDNFAFNYENEIKSIELKEEGMPGIGEKPSRITVNLNHGKKKAFFFNKNYFGKVKSIIQESASDKLTAKNR